ncbi:helix-turn-helix transcriptional regulator [Paenibacillus rhizoplanae]
MKDINREIVAREIYITPGYLSLLFKQQLKISFIDYLHKVRIEHACQLFKDPGMRIEDIALQSGYNDTKYFYQVFKKSIKASRPISSAAIRNNRLITYTPRPTLCTGSFVCVQGLWRFFELRFVWLGLIGGDDWRVKSYTAL